MFHTTQIVSNGLKLTNERHFFGNAQPCMKSFVTSQLYQEARHDNNKKARGLIVWRSQPLHVSSRDLETWRFFPSYGLVFQEWGLFLNISTDKEINITLYHLLTYNEKGSINIFACWQRTYALIRHVEAEHHDNSFNQTSDACASIHRIVTSHLWQAS